MRSLLSPVWVTCIVVAASACRFDDGGVPFGEGVDAPPGTIDAPATIDAPPGTIDAPPGTIDAPPTPIDAAPPDSDLDDDTIENAADNCPTIANTDQHDEDGDAVGDVCDNCPHVANPLQENTTETTPDGVGDACDPDDTGANVIAYFHGFGGSGVPAGWTVVGGTWAQDGDDLRQTATTQANHLIYLTAGSFTDLVVHTRIQVDSVPGAGSGVSALRSVSLVQRYTPGSQLGTGYLCSFFDDVANDQAGFQLASRFANDGSTPDADIDALTIPIDGATVTFEARAIGTGIRCTSTTTGTVTSSIINAMHASGSVALRTNTVAASYEYVVVITPAP